MWWRIMKWFRHIILSKRIFLFLLTFCIVLIIFLAYHKFRITVNSQKNSHFENRYFFDDCACHEPGWRNRFVASEEEKRVFQSVRQEHINILEKLEEASEKLDAINKLFSIREAELKELQIRVEELKLLRNEYSDRRNVQLRLPHSPIYQKIKQTEHPPKQVETEKKFILLEDTFDFSRCSISARFRMFVYSDGINSNSSILAKNYYEELLQQKFYITTNPQEACLFVGILDIAFDNKNNQIFDLRKNFAYFGNHGHNHLILDLSGRMHYDIMEAAILVSSNISKDNIRRSIDIPAFLSISKFDVNRWEQLPQLLPANRKYLLCFMANSIYFTGAQKRFLDDLNNLKRSMGTSQDTYLFDLECPTSSNENQFCYSRVERLHIEKQCTFTLIFPEMASFQQRLYESLEGGSIPVVFSLHASLPFDEFVDWRQAVIRIAPSQFPELHFILRSISVPDTLEFKRKGRYLFENYLIDTKVLIRSIFSLMRFRLQIFGTEEAEPTAIPIYGPDINNSWTYPSFISTATKPPYDDEYLGPAEMILEPPSYTHNFTIFSMYASILWNKFPFALQYSLRFFPNDNFLPSDAEFNEDTAYGMRPILPGSGVEFSQSLGANRPREQFTIVIVSYNREIVLSNTLERLIGLPYLNRVIVIWNNVDRLPSISAWPRMHVPLLFVNGTRNSLNNRFIPYKEIQTEAVLSMDDDIDLKQYEIIFAFRVWREQRDRIVGFPARYHAHFGQENFYNSNHTCQFSMILTGAAFIHKLYMNAYTNYMAPIIRQKVDEWMNCEDLAMNFLVAHITRKPPIKTTSKWTLRCPTCTDTLSNDHEHFSERHECIRFFTQVYGYNPLLFTQFRVDSVLFKTRVPSDHQKCFRYV